MRWILTGLAIVAGLMGGAVVLWTATADDGTPAAGHDHGEQTVASPAADSPYADRYDPAASIRSLTPEEIAQIGRGEGIGFALPAELNGLPGPRHVLDLADELGLSREQRTRVQQVFDDMRATVVPAGQHYLAAVVALEADIRAGRVTERALPSRVAEVYQLEGELAAAHLVSHLQTAEVMTAEQVGTYQRLRGYESGTPHPGTPTS